MIELGIIFERDDKMGKIVPVKYSIIERDTKKKLKKNSTGREYYICKNCKRVHEIPKYIYFRMMLDQIEQTCVCGQTVIFYNAKMWYKQNFCYNHYILYRVYIVIINKNFIEDIERNDDLWQEKQLQI